MNFTIYYRGTEINEVQAKDAKAALKAHSKQFSAGKKGTVIAVGENESVEAHQKAIQDSQVVPQ